MAGRRRLAAVASLLLASLFCLALMALRRTVSGTELHSFLVVNLALAWIPFLLALALYAADRRGSARLTRGLLGGLWLLFLPNAPYVMTDFIHLGPVAPIPLWYDAMLFTSFAWTSLALGIGSVLLVHEVVRHRIGDLLSWAALLPVFVLTSMGVYLGRFVRLNSWDALTRPGRVLHVVAVPLRDPQNHPRLLVVTVIFTLFLIVTYLVVYTVVELRLAPEERAAIEDRRRA